MLEQLKKIDRIYDLMALCSSYILNELKVKSYEFACFEEDDFEEVGAAFERYCCEISEKGHWKAFKELKDFLLEFFSIGVSVEKCYAVVYFIDDNVEITIPDKLLGGNGIVEYSSLNKQYVDQVKIIPKLESTLLTRSEAQFRQNNDTMHELFRKRRECACSKLDTETLHYSIWDQEKIERYPTVIYHVDEKNPISKHFYNRHKIIFGIVPFTKVGLDRILEIKYHHRTFYVDKMYDNAETELKNRYEDIFNRCVNKDIDFLVFPEMLMTENIIDSIKDKDNSNLPQIIVNGSIWKERTNKCIVSDDKGNEIFCYLKKQPFTFEKDGEEYREYLDADKNKSFAILEIEQIGRIGIGICKDLINEEIKLFHKYIGTDILIVPAYTKSMDLQASAEELSKEYNCIVVVVNACSAIEDGTEKKQIGFLTLPAKEKSTRTKITKKYFQDVCKQECEFKCLGKIITIDFYDINQKNDFYCFGVEESVL